MAQSSGMIVALVIVFTILQLIFVALRVAARVVKKVSLGTDDYLIIAAGILFIPLISVPMIIQCVAGNGGNHQPKGPNGFPLPVNYTYQWTSLIIQTSHIIPLALTKAGIIFFYRRIFKLKKAFNVITIITLGVVAIWTITFFFVLLFICVPITKFLHQGSFSPEIHCGNRSAIWNSFSITDFITDLAILIMPIPFVWSVQMAFKLKMAVTGVFLLGALTSLIGMVRLAIFVQESKLGPIKLADYTYYNAPAIYWSLIEASLAIVCASLITLRPLFQAWSPKKIVSYLRGSPMASDDSSSRKRLWPSGRSSVHAQDVELGRTTATAKARGSEYSPLSGGATLPHDAIVMEKNITTTSLREY